MVFLFQHPFGIFSCAWSLLSFACFYQVLGESLHIMTDYLNMEEKVVVANSKVEFVKKELIEALRVEKAHVVQKDEEIQAALLKTDVKREKIIQKFK